MIDHARTAGRPVRCEEVGRTMIVERTRKALRNKLTVDLQRKEIAETARVTPALISYYFPDRSSLFKAAAQPVIDEYVDGLRQILASTDELTSKLRRLVGLYINFNYNEGYLLDFYLQHSKQVGDAEGLRALKTAYEEIVGLFDEMMQMRLLRDGCASTLNSMLWGMCKHVAETLREKLLEVNEDLIAAKAEAIYDCFVNGAGSQVLVQRVANAA